jgi:hypothetical protein
MPPGTGEVNETFTHKQIYFVKHILFYFILRITLRPKRSSDMELLPLAVAIGGAL